MEWPAIAPLVAAINRLKKEKNAVILAHNYMTPEIFNCVGDITGDSLKLAQVAAERADLGRRHLVARVHRAEVVHRAAHPDLQQRVVQVALQLALAARELVPRRTRRPI